MGEIRNKPSKWWLITGGSLILIGIILKVIGITGFYPIVAFISGGFIKVFYMSLGVYRNVFKLGWEVVLLVVGVSLVIVGVFLKANPEQIHLSSWFIAVGVICKMWFVYLFFQRQKRKNS